MTTTNQIAIAAATHTAVIGLPHNNNLRVVPGNFGEAIALNAGAKFALATEDGGVREVVLLKMDIASPQVEVDGRKLHSVLVAEVDDANITITLAPATMIALLNNTDPAIGEPISHINLPAAPLAATKATKVAKEKQPKKASKRDLVRVVYLDSNTRARLLGTPALARKDMLVLFAPILAPMEASGQQTYYNNLRTEVPTPEQMVESEKRVRAQLAAEGIAIPGEEVPEVSDEQVAAALAAADPEDNTIDEEDGVNDEDLVGDVTNVIDPE